MKASVQFLIGSVALATMLSASVVQGAPHGVAAWTIANTATGQFGASAGPRREADDLLRQARKALKDGDFALADTLIGKAEKLNVQYDALTERFYDTPAKLRKVLEEEKAKASGKPAGGMSLPSARFPALLGGKDEPQAQAIPASPFPAPTREEALSQLTNDSQVKARSLLAEARGALAAGNKPAAIAAYQKVLAIPAQYGPTDDSPQRLAADMARAGIDVTSVAPAPSATSPFMLRPSDIDPAAQRLPIDGQAPVAAPEAAMVQQNPSPYALPEGPSNPLNPAPRVGGGSFQPADAASQPQRMPAPEAPTKAEAQRLIAQARFALDKGDLRTAKLFAAQAEAMRLPAEAFGPGEIQPWQVMLDIDRASQQRGGVQLANNEVPAAPAGGGYPVTQGMYNPGQDNSRNVAASSTAAVLNRQGGSPGAALYEEGLAALQNQDRETAFAKFKEAWKFESQLDPETRQQLKDKLNSMSAAVNPLPLQPLDGQPSPLEQVNSQQELLRQKLYREISSEVKSAEQLAASEPRTALENLNKLRTRIASAEVEPAALKQLLTIVDRKVSELTIYIEQNESTISNDERNASIRADLVRSEQLKLQTQDKLAQLVENFNELMDQRRFPEAEVIAKQAREIAPNEPVVVNMVEKSRLARGIYESMMTDEAKATNFIAAMESVHQSGVAFDDRTPLVFGDAKKWSELTRSRKSLLERRTKLSPAELEIERSLGKPIEARFENRPLSEVLDTLGKMTGINIFLDPQGLHAEGVTSDTPVSLNLQQPISLKSALNLLLENHGLSYVIQNEVLRITSEQTRNSNVYPQTYYVADLVIPIPNFVPSYNIGLPGAIRESLNSMGYGMPARAMSTGPLTLAQGEDNKAATPSNASVLAQMGAANVLPGSGAQRGPTSLGGGPGGMGGGVQADFDTLIELITSTIAPTTWDEVGGPGSISGFDVNLSLVVSQTQEVHEQIADLLEQLRRLQDLQVTIEVRFITLSDRFFERIGIDFDFNIDDNTGLNNVTDQLPTANQPGQGVYDDSSPSLNFGLNPTTGLPSADLDLGFRQGSFGSAVPQFGGFDAGTAASFGFAILSDIEVFFLLNAAQGDDRTNILQAPKVTLFNGQQAFVSDTSQRPFVISVIPVVGDFAAAQQPVIAVLNEGTSLSVQGVVSPDRRFVRLTMVPFFSTIGDVDTFTFTGSTTTDSGSVIQDPSNPDENATDNVRTTTEGTTVQLPTFAFTTVTTTVSVPDGGTVLLGGIKRLREGRNERGVPLLSKVPYVSRLFKNVGIGREAQSLMMMVTPRIIIQEEEEEKLGIDLPQ
ncbi:type II and III secretion system protein [Pirellula staleyi DSM 6068]|uniref:Type II and III secretion system protein n=1 Tax=Pirellula staleyi (strain ATCC 27377 / DSM 6068 / ICPB 4128) TaxID=530564 RepID=D2R0W7_PIRSD|nr:type II and III secretion system protein [Pirellula staleyi DSM 6068]